jgi:hypothetical protein
MKIIGLEGRTDADINRELERGAKFVIFQYTISIIVMTFRRSSDIYYIPAGSSGFARGLPFVLISFLLGWWGIPWGPVYTIGSLANNLSGGKNVTKELIRAINSSEAVA